MALLGQLSKFFLKQFNIKKETFIGGWFISSKTCDELINYFKSKKQEHVKGYVLDDTTRTINPNVKDSVELGFEIDKIDFTDSSNNIISKYFKELQLVLNQYFKKYPESTKEIASFKCKFFNIQFYKANGGFKNYHAERNCIKNSSRHLVFMTYLNDVPNGGTQFKYQNLIVPAKKGLTTLWPPDWTHTHKSQISKKHSKYIITGWFEYTH